MEERDLIDAVIDGRPGAFATLQNVYGPVVNGTARRLLHRFPREDVQDVFQDVFTRLWLNDWRVLRDVRAEWTEGSLPRYLRRMARNAAFDLLRRRRREVTGLEHDEGDDGLLDALHRLFAENDEASTLTGPEHEVVLGQLRRILQDALAQLGDRCGEVIKLVHLLDVEMRDAAAELGITRGNLRVVLHRCLGRLRQLVDREYPVLKEYLEIPL